MRGNIVLAAAIFGLSVIIGCGLLVLGGRWVAMDAVDRLNVAFDHHGQSIVQAGTTISAAKVTLLGPVPIVDHEPLRIQGTHGKDSSIPVDARWFGK
jgi:hypothetical protein